MRSGMMGLRWYAGSVTVVYDPNSGIFTIWAYNEYGDTVYLSENMRETRSFVKSIWTGETVILEGIEWWE